MSKFFTMLLGATGASLMLVFVLSLVFNSEIALRPLGITTGLLGLVLVILSWLTGEVTRRRASSSLSNSSLYTLERR